VDFRAAVSNQKLQAPPGTPSRSPSSGVPLAASTMVVSAVAVGVKPSFRS